MVSEVVGRRKEITNEALERLYQSGYSTYEICELTDIPRSTIRKRLKKASVIFRTPQHAINLAISKGRTTSHPGKKNPNWRGGRHYCNGYVYIYKPKHPRAASHKSAKNVVLEHQLVWEKEHKRPLPEGWIIHHLNGIRDDNRPDNLVALSSQKHALVIAEQQKRVRGLEEYIIELQGKLYPYEEQRKWYDDLWKEKK